MRSQRRHAHRRRNPDRPARSCTACATSSACRARAISPRSTPSTTATIALTVCRQEGGAAMMAEAVGKATGRPGICFVTRGPGATNASAGIHIAQPGFHADDRVRRPGRRATCASAKRSRSSTIARCSARMAKWATEIDDPARIPEIVSRAFHTAMQRPARPGGDRAAGGHADRARRRAGRAGLRAGRDLAGPDRHEPAAEAALGGQASGRAARRQPLVGGRVRRARALRRALCAAGRHHLPPRRICSTRCIPATPAISASAPIRNCSRASRPPTWCC